MKSKYFSAKCCLLLSLHVDKRGFLVAIFDIVLFSFHLYLVGLLNREIPSVVLKYLVKFFWVFFQSLTDEVLFFSSLRANTLGKGMNTLILLSMC